MWFLFCTFVRISHHAFSKYSNGFEWWTRLCVTAFHRVLFIYFLSFGVSVWRNTFHFDSLLNCLALRDGQIPFVKWLLESVTAHAPIYTTPLFFSLFNQIWMGNVRQVRWKSLCVFSLTILCLIFPFHLFVYRKEKKKKKTWDVCCPHVDLQDNGPTSQ